MNEKQIEVFKELLQSSDFKGKKQLEHLLWLNTTKPKYNVGDCFKATDAGRKIYEKPVIDFNAKIVKQYSLKTDNEWLYELEAVCKHGDKEYTAKIYASESELTERTDTNENII